MAYMPKSRVVFWAKKFDENVARDRRIRRELIKLDWRVITVWECQTKPAADLIARLKKLIDKYGQE
jgi:DNA mismatch endonuclease (patch repair protein)